MALASCPARQARGRAGDHGRRKHTVAEIAGTFGVSRKTVYPAPRTIR
jgi:hypothetical protein